MRLRVAPVFAVYLGRRFLGSIMVVYAPVMTLIYMIDVLELVRRAGRGSGPPVDLLTLMTMSALKLPSLAMAALPFACLFGAMWSFVRMTRSNELVIARAAGLSVWQFLAPPLLVVLLLGLFAVGVVNPWSAAMTYRYRQLENYYIKGATSSLSTVNDTGIWLRQADPAGSAIIRAAVATDGGLRLSGVIVLMLDRDGHFLRRVEASYAQYEPGYWTLTSAWLFESEAPARPVPVFRLATNLEPDDITQSLADPESISFWAIPAFAKRLEQAGFSATRYLVHWHSLAATPLVLAGMLLIAATVSLRMSRRGGIAALIGLGSVASFVLFVVFDVARALGISESVPVVLASWGPPVAATLVSVALLFHLEDG